MTIQDDFRGLDEKEFIKIFSLLRLKTNNFKRFYPELILENNQYLLIIRICLGLSQTDFGKILGVTKDWCRHTEAGRNRIIHKKVAERYSEKLNILIRESKINLENSLKRWEEYKFAREQEFEEIRTKYKQISKLDKKELKKFFNHVRDRTNNFMVFNCQTLLESPQSFLIFRLVLGKCHKEFARLLCLNPRSVRKYEYGDIRMKRMTAKRCIKIIEMLFKASNLTGKVRFENVLENFRIMTNFFGHRNMDALMDVGLNHLAKLNRSNFEDGIEKMLKTNKIDFERFAVVEGIKRKYNVDFAIPNGKNPKIIIEAFEFTVGGKSKNVKTKVCLTDHRFQMIKNKNQNIKTAMIIRLIGKPILKSFIMKSLEMEIINTDFLFVNEEFENVLLELRKQF